MTISRTPEFVFYRGSTICLECGMPVELLSTDTIYATFYQIDHRVIEYQKNGTADTALRAPTGHLEIDEENHYLLQILMSQEDTLRLEDGEALLQIRISRTDGTDTLADTMVPVFGWVGEAFKEGEI